MKGLTWYMMIMGQFWAATSRVAVPEATRVRSAWRVTASIPVRWMSISRDSIAVARKCSSFRSSAAVVRKRRWLLVRRPARRLQEALVYSRSDRMGQVLQMSIFSFQFLLEAHSQRVPLRNQQRCPAWNSHAGHSFFMSHFLRFQQSRRLIVMSLRWLTSRK